VSAETPDFQLCANEVALVRKNLIIIAACLSRTAPIEVITEVKSKSAMFADIAPNPKACLVHVLVHLILSSACKHLALIFIMKRENKRLASAIKLLPVLPFFKVQRSELVSLLIFTHDHSDILTPHELHECDHRDAVHRHPIQQRPILTAVLSCHLCGQV